MGYFKKLLEGKDKKTLYNLLLLFSVGIALLVMGQVLFPKPGGTDASSPPQSEPPPVTAITEPSESYEERLERRLADILSCVENAGEVRVMLTLSHGKELTVARDARTERSTTQEADAEGGTRSAGSESEAGQTVVLRGADGGETPLVLKEAEPRVEGALIIAEGGDDIFVKDALIRAAYTVLGIEPHKVQVFKMEQK